MLAIEHSVYAQAPWGMALFVGRGFGAWMHAWTQATPMHDPSNAPPTRIIAASESVSLPSQVQTQMVSALASMVLDALRGEAA